MRERGGGGGGVARASSSPANTRSQRPCYRARGCAARAITGRVRRQRAITGHEREEAAAAAASRAQALLPLTLAVSARVIGHEGAPRALSRGERGGSALSPGMREGAAAADALSRRRGG